MVVVEQDRTGGGVVVMDALGFKALRRTRPADIVAGIRAARTAAKSAASVRNFLSADRFHYAALSDTVILAAEPGSPDAPAHEARGTDHMLLGLAAAAAAVCVEAAKGPLPLAFRGCLSSGDIVVDDDIFLGEAIDDAAEWYEQADAAAVWLTPKACKSISIGSSLAWFQWDVPLKGVGTLTTLVVNPFYHEILEGFTRDPLGSLLERIDPIREAMLASFRTSVRIDVVRKLQNTAKLLEVARAHTCEHYEQERDEYFQEDARAQEEYFAEPA